MALSMPCGRDSHGHATSGAWPMRTALLTRRETDPAESVIAVMRVLRLDVVTLVCPRRVVELVTADDSGQFVTLQTASGDGRLR